MSEYICTMTREIKCKDRTLLLCSKVVFFFDWVGLSLKLNITHTVFPCAHLSNHRILLKRLFYGWIYANHLIWLIFRPIGIGQCQPFYFLWCCNVPGSIVRIYWCYVLFVHLNISIVDVILLVLELSQFSIAWGLEWEWNYDNTIV